MDFKTAMEHVRNGTATEEEHRLVDEEIEKHLLITEHLDAQWEKELPSVPEALPEIKQLHAKLRRHNILLILTCLLLVAAIAAAVAAYLAPRMEEKQQQQVQQQVQQEVVPQVQQQLEDKEKAIAAENAKYWDPNECTYTEEFTDLNLTLSCHAELHMWSFRSCYAGTPVQTGIGTYQIPITATRSTKYEVMYLQASLEKDVLTLPPELHDGFNHGMFSDLNYFPEENFIIPDSFFADRELHNSSSRRTLSQLPDYFIVTADVTFPEKLDMSQLLAFRDQLYSMDTSLITWVGIKIGHPGVCGMNPFNGHRVVYEDFSQEYPYLQRHDKNASPENLEQHFKSLLKFAQAQLDRGRWIDRYNKPSLYADALAYVEENGVYSYGCRIKATPSVLLELLENGVVDCIIKQDIEIIA